MTTPRVETAEDLFREMTKLRESPSLTDDDWLDIVNQFIIESGDDLHTATSALLVEAYGDLLANRS